ncbi:hypothetical protein D3C76_1158170 [compost metagenome]
MAARGITGSPSMHQQVSVTSVAPKVSMTSMYPASRACSNTARPQVMASTTSGCLTRSRHSCAKRANSLSEKCGLPSETTSTRLSLALLSSRQLTSRSSRRMVATGSGVSGSSTCAGSSASGVTPAMWNSGAADVVANAAPKAFKSSRSGWRCSRPNISGIRLPASAPMW